jgi:hypothetical protein
MRLAAIGGAGFATRALGLFLQLAGRKRRGLSIRPTTRHLEFFLQPLVLMRLVTT